MTGLGDCGTVVRSKRHEKGTDMKCDDPRHHEDRATILEHIGRFVDMLPDLSAEIAGYVQEDDVDKIVLALVEVNRSLNNLGHMLSHFIDEKAVMHMMINGWITEARKTWEKRHAEYVKRLVDLSAKRAQEQGHDAAVEKIRKVFSGVTVVEVPLDNDGPSTGMYL